MVRSQPVDAPLQTLLLEHNEWVPNNPRLPVLIYIKAITANGCDPAVNFEETFSNNGWPPQWRSGVYDYHHYHTQGHEVLGVVSGFAHLILGGPKGRMLEVSAGDVLLLPVGTGHCNAQCSDDFLVVGAYPPGQHADTCCQAPSQEQLSSILSLPFPERDPVQGLNGAVSRYWGVTWPPIVHS
ncbi:cupin [Pseudomonas alkylphenolica]|uniref:cupin n=1 Tax=Pseudomonas alkylphenolica TaxID=237609 RepID=UPI0018D9EA67|nr:cupin [Pseudomonas alkylphenolica]MBH3428920.1 cupin [Pseudomonas alkylphenolica]